MSILKHDNSKELIEEYKEAGLQYRHYSSEITSTSRLMLPPMIIGLLILYGNVGKFVGVEIKNAVALYWLVVVGCAIISLMWIINVTRFTQLIHRNGKTLIAGERKLELRGHTMIRDMDTNSRAPLIFRHRHLRFLGFWIYLSLLLNVNVFERLIPRVIEAHTSLLWPLIVVLLSGILTLWIRKIFFAGLTSQSEFKCDKFKCKDWSIIATIAVILISYSLIPQVALDANASLIRGLNHYGKGNYEAASEAYKKAIELDSEYAPAYALRGLEHSAKGDDEKSNEDWNEAKKRRKEQ